MSAIEPAGDKIVRNLQQAVERLHDDLARVELWAGALGCFTKPIPDYAHGQTKFDLPAAQSADRTASKSGPKNGPKSAPKPGRTAPPNPAAKS